MILGLNSNELKLVPHDPEWKDAFLNEKGKILNVIGDKIITIEHIGSTAIESICAKPIIDIAIAIEKYEDGYECIKPLESLGYEYKGEFGIKGRHYFKTRGKLVKFHIHFFVISSNQWEDHILFRDYLVKHNEYAEQYHQLKQKLLFECNGDRSLYTERKTSFCQMIIEKARKEKNIN